VLAAAILFIALGAVAVIVTQSGRPPAAPVAVEYSANSTPFTFPPRPTSVRVAGWVTISAWPPRLALRLPKVLDVPRQTPKPAEARRVSPRPLSSPEWLLTHVEQPVADAQNQLVGLLPPETRFLIREIQVVTSRRGASKSRS
jgi:hypothetical protein